MVESYFLEFRTHWLGFEALFGGLQGNYSMVESYFGIQDALVGVRSIDWGVKGQLRSLRGMSTFSFLRILSTVPLIANK